MKRWDLLLIGLLAAAMSAPMPAWPHDRYPLRPVRLVIPSVPAGVHDVIGRVWAERVKPQFGALRLAAARRARAWRMRARRAVTAGEVGVPQPAPCRRSPPIPSGARRS